MHCVRHVYTNINNKRYCGLEMEIGFWGAMKTYMNLHYNNYLKDIGDVDQESLNLLKKFNLRHGQDICLMQRLRI